MRRWGLWAGVLATLGVLGVLAVSVMPTQPMRKKPARQPIDFHSPTELIKQGQQVFRYDTFGDEAFFYEKLRLPFRVLVSMPAAARERSFGVVTDKTGKIVGIQEVRVNGRKEWGITCAFCHSTVDKNGNRLDGVPNSRLNAGAILALSPTFPMEERRRLMRWGRGRFDTTFMNEAEDHKDNPVKIMPPFNAKGDKHFNWNGFWDNVTDRNHYTADIVMHGQGRFPLRRFVPLDNKEAVAPEDDLIGPKMKALTAYNEALRPPRPGSVDERLAARGKELFSGRARCAECHTPPDYTNHAITPVKVVQTEPSRATTPPFDTGGYKVPSLRGVSFTGPPFFHDGSARSLREVLDHYDRIFKLGLSDDEKRALEAFLQSL